jgi:enoyl-CoA hydratase
MYQTLRDLQKPFMNVFECNVPVLVGIHGKCIGGGVDLISMCDIRYCTAYAEFSIK